jgi:hypothetical protein
VADSHCSECAKAGSPRTDGDSQSTVDDAYDEIFHIAICDRSLPEILRVRLLSMPGEAGCGDSEAVFLRQRKEYASEKVAREVRANAPVLPQVCELFGAGRRVTEGFSTHA